MRGKLDSMAQEILAAEASRQVAEEARKESQELRERVVRQEQLLTEVQATLRVLRRDGAAQATRAAGAAP
jgi:hypothetical protein